MKDASHEELPTFITITLACSYCWLYFRPIVFSVK